MSEPKAALANEQGLAEAIGLLRDELLSARTAGADSDIQLPVESMTVTATRSLDGKAAFTVPVVFGDPVARAGNPVKVAQPSSERQG